MDKLSSDRLKNSVYYCAAGIDLQPLLRFGDITSDFVYVSIGIKRKDLIKGLETFVANLNIQKNNTILKINSIHNFDFHDIDYLDQGHLFYRKPDWISDNDFARYKASFSELIINSEQYKLHVNFTLFIGPIERSLDLFYISGEGLSVYEALFVIQNIAPKIFISIQSGLIEVPSVFTNRMFASHTNRPKVWIRGVWTDNSIYNEDFRPDVFNISGHFNKQIGDFRNWDSHLGANVQGVTDDSKKYRLVKGYGEEKEWTLSDDDRNILYESKNKNLRIRKLFQHWSGDLYENYSDGLADFDFSNFKMKLNKDSTILYLDNIYEEYKFISEQHPKIKAYKKAILQIGEFESTEMYLSHFIKSFKVINNVKLIIDIYYKNELDFIRSF